MNLGQPTLLLIFAGMGLCYAGTSILLLNLKKVSRSKIQSWILKGTSNRWMAALWGIFINAIVNQSTASTPIIASFTASKIISLRNAIYMAIWGNVGGVFLLYILSLPLGSIDTLLIAISGCLYPFINREPLSSFVKALFGISLLIYGTLLINSASSTENLLPIKDFFMFLSGKNELLFIPLGLICQLAMQSGIVLIILLAEFLKTGMIDLSQAFLFICGTRLGIGFMIYVTGAHFKGVALRLVLAQVIYNVAGVLVCLLIFIIEKWTALPLEVNLISTLFVSPLNQIINIVNYFCLISALSLTLCDNFLIKTLQHFLPHDEIDPTIPQYIISYTTHDPELCLDLAYKEEVRVLEQINLYIDYIKQGFENPLETQKLPLVNFNILHNEIYKYLLNIENHMNTKELIKRFLNFLTLSSSIQALGLNLKHLCDNCPVIPTENLRLRHFYGTAIESMEFTQMLLYNSMKDRKLQDIRIVEKLSSDPSKLIEIYERHLKDSEISFLIANSFLRFRELTKEIASSLIKELEYKKNNSTYTALL